MAFSAVTSLIDRRFNVPSKVKTGMVVFDITIALGAITTSLLALHGIPHLNAMSTNTAYGLLAAGSFEVVLLAIKEGLWIRRLKQERANMERELNTTRQEHADMEGERDTARIENEVLGIRVGTLQEMVRSLRTDNADLLEGLRGPIGDEFERRVEEIKRKLAHQLAGIAEEHLEPLRAENECLKAELAEIIAALGE